MTTNSFHWATGETIENPGDINYTTTEKCDGCGKHAEGTMMHARGATGRVCPVLFLCHECHEPEETEEPQGPTDFSDDAEALASAGWGTDEDYGYTNDHGGEG